MRTQRKILKNIFKLNKDIIYFLTYIWAVFLSVEQYQHLQRQLNTLSWFTLFHMKNICKGNDQSPFFDESVNCMVRLIEFSLRYLLLLCLLMCLFFCREEEGEAIVKEKVPEVR